MSKIKNLNDLYWFCLSVQCGGFSAASIKAKTSAPTVSRAVSRLEEQLNEKLLHRNAKNFHLTNTGEEVYKNFAHVFSMLDEEWLNLANNQGTLTGDIHVSCPEPFADFYLQRLAIDFMALHPEVNIHVHFATDANDFIDNQIDLAVVTVPATASHLVQKRLFETELILAAAPSYLAQNGRPEHVNELVNHHLLASNTLPFWTFKQQGETIKVPVKPKYSINSLRLKIQAAIAGAGICLVPKPAFKQLISSGKLVAIIPDAQCSMGNSYMVWTDRKMISSRVTAFRDLIFDSISSGTETLWNDMLS